MSILRTIFFTKKSWKYVDMSLYRLNADFYIICFFFFEKRLERKRKKRLEGLKYTIGTVKNFNY